jgi:alpha-D-xyloside xylohydrolase
VIGVRLFPVGALMLLACSSGGNDDQDGTGGVAPNTGGMMPGGGTSGTGALPATGGVLASGGLGAAGSGATGGQVGVGGLGTTGGGGSGGTGGVLTGGSVGTGGLGGGGLGGTGGTSASGGTGALGGGGLGGSAGEATGGVPATGGAPTVDCPAPVLTGDHHTTDETGVTFTLDGGLQRLDVCQADIIRVRYTTEGSLPDKTSLSVNAQWGTPSFCVTEDAGIVTITTVRMKAKVETSTGAVSYTDLDDGVVLQEEGKNTTPTTVEGVSTNRIETSFASPTDEALFGLGQHQDNVMNRKGTDRHIENHNTEINVPLLVSNRGYGLFWDNYSASDFYGGEAGNTRYRYVSEAGEAVDYYFFYGPSMDEVVARYRRTTGTAPMFPKWAYGLFHSKDKYESQNEILSVLSGYRDNDIPVDCIVQDWAYWEPQAWGSHVMDSSRYPDPEGLVNQFHDANVHGMISIWPVYQDMNNPNFDELNAAGGLLPGGTSGHQFYDTYSAEAREIAWRQQNEQLFSRYGWDGIWADNTEPQDYPAGSINTRTATTALGPMALVINAFPLQHAKGVYEGWRSSGPQDKRVYILTRSAFAGSQRYAASTWSGDIDCDFNTYRRQIPAGLNYAAAGMPYWTTDIGGYWGHPGRVDWTTSESNEVFTRWFQYGAFCPIFRVHGGGSRELYGDQWTAETKANLLEIDNLRYRLMPYIYSLAWKVTSEGYTIMRPLVFDYPTDSQVFDIKDQFLFGPALLVNPVTAAGVTSRDVYLPGGTWYDFWTGSTTAGGTTTRADAPLSRIPLFVKAGSIVPMGPFIQYATESADPLEIRIYPGQDGTFTLYEDGGDTYAYETGEYAQIQFTWDDAAQQLTVGARTGTFPGMLATRTFNVVLVDASHGAGVPVGTADTSVSYDGSAVVVSMN